MAVEAELPAVNVNCPSTITAGPGIPRPGPAPNAEHFTNASDQPKKQTTKYHSGPSVS